jgi:hypothetical protein
MTCKKLEIKELLPAYVSDELDQDSGDRIERHLASCEDCRQELGLLAMMSEEGVPDPGEAFWTQLPGKVEREVRAGKNQPKLPGLSRLLDRLLLPRWTWTAASLAVVLLVAWLMVEPFRHEGEMPALHDVYDIGYGSLHDPVLTHPSTNMADLSEPQLATVDSWAGQELTTIAFEAESIAPNAPDREEYEELAELNGHEIERLSTMLDDYYEEG